MNSKVLEWIERLKAHLEEEKRKGIVKEKFLKHFAMEPQLVTIYQGKALAKTTFILDRERIRVLGWRLWKIEFVVCENEGEVDQDFNDQDFKLEKEERDNVLIYKFVKEEGNLKIEVRFEIHCWD
jgi:hypothetical protein